MQNELYQATTLTPSMWNLKDPVVKRHRVLSLLNNTTHSGSIGWIVGPLGSGKSTVALQWAMEMDTEVQLVSARPPLVVPTSEIQPPSPLGLALQNFLNACSNEQEIASAEEIEACLDRVVELSRKQRQPFILDDLELVRREAMDTLTLLFAKALPQLLVNRALFVSRTTNANVIGGLQAQRTLRMVLPSTLELDPEEAQEAHRLGVFGTATLDSVLKARERSAGWITGMLTELHGHGGRTIPLSQFSTNVLNSMLLRQPAPVLQTMIASALLPFNSMDIWERWFSELGIPKWAIPSTLTQLPTRARESTNDHFVIVPAMAEALRNTRSITASDDTLRTLLIIAMEWYIDNAEIEAATTLAKEHNLNAEYLRLIKPKAIELSRAEEWHAIADLVELLPTDVIISDPDISFWYTYALASETRWSDVVDIQSRGDAVWSASESPIVRARNHLMIGSIARAQGDYEEALRSFEQAYDTLPKSAHQERMYAAASAGTSASQIRLGQDSLPWRQRTAYELAHLPPRQRWWHGNMGPVALGYVASSGRMELAYTQAEQQVAGLQEIGPDLSWRYLLLMAAIDTERMRLDSAADALKNAQPYIQSPLQQQMILIAESKVLAAQGNFEAAMAKLDSTPYSAGRSINNEFISKLTLARHAFDSGDVATAELTLGSAAWPSDSWPRNFGDPHPNLIRALINADTGDLEKSLELAGQVHQEARYRRNRFLEIRSHAVLAHLHHKLGDTAARNQEILAATDLNTVSGYQLVFFIKGKDIRTLAESVQVVAGDNNSHTRLTSREAEVLELVAQSYSNKEIAEKMYISVSTVKNHLASVYDKLGTNNRRAAVLIARKNGLVAS